jgi:transposase
MTGKGFFLPNFLIMKRKPSKKESMVNLPLVNPNAAGIDVGDTIHAVAVPEGRDELRVRTFGTMTCACMP